MLSGYMLRKIVSKQRVLDDVSIRVAPGTLTALIGPSGGSKTTLARALALVEPPDQGRVTIGSTEYDFPRRGGATPFCPWPTVSVVWQQHFLWPHLRLKEQILLPARVRGDRFANKSFDQLVEMFSMHDFVDRYPNQVSLGQRQRAALARALMADPKYLILDEVTSSLDPEQAAMIMLQVRKLPATGLGVLAITHSMALGRQADEVSFITRGRIVETGNCSILANPKSLELRSFLSADASV